MKRSLKRSLAHETLEIIERGDYVAPSGKNVRIKGALFCAAAGSKLYRPDDFPAPLQPAGAAGAVIAEVTGETTLAAARRLAGSDVVALNFASAKNPGGGFLNGAEAQEESLARSSGLYACLTANREMYEYNRQLRTGLYSDHMIYAPRIPVFRDDQGALLENPYLVSIITAPAVNAGVVMRGGSGEHELIRPIMQTRLANLLWVAHQHNHRAIILGAWGCGVFRNDPAMIAELFAEALGPQGRYRAWFDHIVYAVYDRSEGHFTLGAFQRQLSKGALNE